MKQNKHIKRLRAGVLAGALCLLLPGLPGRAYAQNRAVSLEQAIADSAEYLAGLEQLPKGSRVAFMNFDTINFDTPAPALSNSIIKQ